MIASTVDYEKLSADPRYDKYVQQLAGADFDTLPPAEQLALLMNAYNAFCIGHVVARFRSGATADLTSILALKRGAGGRNVLAFGLSDGTENPPRVLAIAGCAS